MSDEPTNTVLAVRIDYLERLMSERERYYLEKINGQIGRIDGLIFAGEKALKIADDSLNHWKASSNEWRKSLEDARSSNLSRTEAMSEFKRLGERIDQHEKALNQISGRSTGVNSFWIVLSTILGLIGAALLVVVEVKK